MCGVAGAVHLAGEPMPLLHSTLQPRMSGKRIVGRTAPGIWASARHVGLARGLSIIDLPAVAAMTDPAGNRLVFNGEITTTSSFATSSAQYFRPNPIRK